MNILDWLSSGKGEIAVAGIAGSAVSVVMEWNGIGSGIRRLFVGAVAAYFMAPLGVPLFQWSLGHLEVAGEQAASVGGFIMGLAGVIIIEIVLKAFRLRSAELSQPAARRRRRRDDEA
ncbi:hypothetical protein ASC97_05555 [Rhizobium sp. Root1203]|uniref:hypothetical protein n=1 Tax=Rhizobium sp. Root1203 TaxID=1736427 RepID=UPI0007097EF2|nr:hypothetical protein [Rhizobium sp. Root1203]KQV28538.1 hypothetical protein ASC97_05555 [Rhizobium sp. Root1203]